MKTQGIFEFSEFSLDPRTRTLKRRGEAVMLNRRAYDLLLYLVQNPGRILPREELVKNIWPDTFVDDNNLAQSISALRRALEEKPGDNNYVVTVPGRGYQFVSEVRNTALEISEVAPVEMPAVGAGAAGVILERETIRTSITRQENGLPALPAPKRATTKMVAAVVVLMVLGGSAYWIHLRFARHLTAKDTMVLADFVNTTGDAVFDDALRQGLSVQLEQSPFLNLLSDQRIGQTLSLMTRPKDARLSPELAREVCQRTGSTAVLNGTIAQIGSRYLLTLRAIDCATGDSLASAEATANDKDHVLDALGAIATDIRPRLGESLASVQKFDVALGQATTPSLEALKALTLGEKLLYQRDAASAVPHFQRALELDPNFATAYMQLGITYYSLGEPERAKECFERAFLLREHTNEREKLQIAAGYYGHVTGELDKAVRALQQVIEIYKHSGAYNGLADRYARLGEYEKSADAARSLLALSPDQTFGFVILAMDDMALQNFEAARQIIGKAQARGVDSYLLHIELYTLSFLRADSAGMEEQQRWLAGKPAYENYGLALAADTEAYGGHLNRARDLARLASDSALRVDNKEGAAMYRADDALREAAYGNSAMARQSGAEALKLASGNAGIAVQTALAFAMSGEGAPALRVVHDLEKRFPLDTQMQTLGIPAIKAQLHLEQREPEAALDVLRAGLAFEFANTDFSSINTSCLYPTYIRGQAYLAAGQGKAAAAEFQKIIDHSGLVGNCWTGALALLGVGRANALMSHEADAAAAREKAVAAYKDFFILWKDADPGIPVLKQARAEYAKLQ